MSNLRLIGHHRDCCSNTRCWRDGAGGGGAGGGIKERRIVAGGRCWRQAELLRGMRFKNIR